MYTRVGIQCQATNITVPSIFSVLGTNLSWFELRGCWIVYEIIANAIYADKVVGRSKLNSKHAQ